MLPVYLFCLVLGVGLAVLSASADLFDAGGESVTLTADRPPGGRTADESGASSGSEAEVPGGGRPAALFPLRSLSYSLAGFGAAGALLTAFGAGPGAPLTLGFSALAGLVIGGAAGSLMALVRRLARGS